MNRASNQEARVYLNQYAGMIEKAAWHARKTYKIDIEEARSQAYLIFCETLHRYDSSNAAAFGTYLYTRLKHLQVLAHRDFRRRPRTAQAYIDNVESHRYEVVANELELLESSSELSDDAQCVLKFILDREWDIPGVSNWQPRVKATALWFNHEYKWSGYRTAKAWKEAKTWWKATKHPYKEEV